MFISPSDIKFAWLCVSCLVTAVRIVYILTLFFMKIWCVACEDLSSHSISVSTYCSHKNIAESWCKFFNLREYRRRFLHRNDIVLHRYRWKFYSVPVCKLKPSRDLFKNINSLNSL